MICPKSQIRLLWQSWELNPGAQILRLLFLSGGIRNGDGHKSQHGKRGSWLVLGEGQSLWNPIAFLALWNRRRGFDRHREAGTESQCGECEYSDGTYWAMETWAGDLPRDVITPLTLF